jgi:GNAT superfamily N-acetyltransferase
MIEYRKATYNDIHTLTQMRLSMLCDGSSYSEEFKEILSNNTAEYIHKGLTDNSFAAWLASENNQIIAMSGIAFYELPPNDWCPNGKTAYIGNMYTVPEFRKQGIATKLLALVIEEAKERGCERILLNTTDMGRPLYEKFGFDISPTAMAYFPKM